MRLTLFSICLLLFSSAFSQHPIAAKLWVGDADNYMQVDSNAIVVQYNYEYNGSRGLMTNSYKYKVLGDTLRLVDWYHNSEVHDFLIESLPNNDLKLMPVNRYAWTFGNSRFPKKTFTFREQERIYTDTIRFEKILFSSTNCYGHCPAMSFQIDNNKQMKFIGSFYAVKQGAYTAELSKNLYNELLQLLAISNLDKLENVGKFNIDLPTIGVEVHYNHKIKYLKTSFPPYVTSKLMRYLYDLPQKVELKEAAPMEIHFSTPGGELDIFHRKQPAKPSCWLQLT